MHRSEGPVGRFITRVGLAVAVGIACLTGLLPLASSAVPSPAVGPRPAAALQGISAPHLRPVSALHLGGLHAVSLSRYAPVGGMPATVLPEPSPIHRVPGPPIVSPGSGPHPHSVVPSGSSFSTNWSGQILSGQTYTGVQASWVVPTVQASVGDDYSATWVGIDGTSSSTLIQTGTSQDSVGGTVTYSAWVELLPGAAMTVAAPVFAGDSMQGTVTETGTDQWTVTIVDNTQSWVSSNPFTYSTPGTTAEWIEEAPTVNGGQATLANFGSASFSGMAIQVVGSGSSFLSPVYMLTPDESAFVAYPGPFISNSFSDFYGSPPPAVTSVSPAEGLTGGGSFVTIQGDFLIGAENVTFGGTATYFAVNSDGSITAIAPAEGAGRVDIVVTTPGGASIASAADQFTYLVPAPPPPPPPPPTVTPHGYWLVGADGGIFTFGAAQFYGSTGNLRLQRPIVGITPTGSRSGYWLVASDGGVFAFGDAGFYGSIPGLGYSPAGTRGAHPLNAPVVGMVPSADGGGYFMVAADGGVFAFGDARFAGSCPAIGGCVGSAVAVLPDGSGNGYWVVTATGSVYSFGDATYYGGPGSQGSVVTSAARTPDGNGYWILFANGTVTAFGDAVGYGGPSADAGRSPANAIFTAADGGGYWVALANGAVYSYGDAPYEGGMGAVRLNAPVIAATGW